MQHITIHQRSDGTTFDATVDDRRATVNGEVVQLIDAAPNAVYTLQLGNKQVPVKVESVGVHGIAIWLNGYAYEFDVLDQRHAQLLEILKASPAAQSRTVRLAAPMPGLLKAVHATNGDVVKKGDILFTLEAMKMENAIKAPAAGVVAHCDIAPGVPVEKGATLCTIEPSTL